MERDPRFPDIRYEWLIELKVVKKADAGELEAVKEQGLRQLRRYARNRDLAGKPGIRQALVIFIGKDEALVVEP